MQPVTYHLTPTEIWLGQEGAANYVPEQFSLDGFIHCTDGEAEVLSTGNRFYTGDRRNFCLLTIATAMVRAKIIYEDDQEIFPHIYGPLNISSVIEVRTIQRTDDGHFDAIGGPLSCIGEDRH